MTDVSRLPGPMIDAWEWQYEAACRDLDTELFFHPEGERGSTRRRRAANAKAICATCPVIEQCRSYALAAQEIDPELADLVADGTLRVEWYDLAQITDSSPLAAQAGIAAGEQGKFWEFHDAVYAAADPNGHPQYSEQALVDFAAKAGVPDLDKFRATMRDPLTVTKVSSAKEQAHQAGITGTPTLFINKAYIPGFRDAAYVRNTVLAQLAETAS